MVLSNEEMFKVKGGSASIYVKMGILGGLIAFFAGMLNGVIYPENC